MSLKLYWFVGLFLLVFSIGNAFGQTCSTAIDSATQTFYYEHPEKMASYAGGQDSIRWILNHHLRYPPHHCMRDCIDGTVFLSFIIDTDGRIFCPQVLKGVVKSIDEEALKVLQFMNYWIPGECHGKKVPTRFVLPIRFISP